MPSSPVCFPANPPAAAVQAESQHYRAGLWLYCHQHSMMGATFLFTSVPPGGSSGDITAVHKDPDHGMGFSP